MTKSPVPVSYEERVLPSLGFFVAGLFLPAALFLISLPFALELALGVAVGSYLVFFIFSYLLAPKISVAHHVLHVNNALITKDLLGQTIIVEGKDQFLERGQRLSTLAYTKFQIGVKGLVKIELKDEKDPTPYWLIATRHPEVLASHLNAKR
ncbi:MAG: DUF3093 family protein [Actinobacteria bacterium]|uniref:Unannotated protein n=1 Tax=freshwater metagenome TaxID=449393 RepID=A0A6J6NXP6_9ZZZZ|nr:DUF3093 family protein [Actinomycetota bacterium]